MALVMMLNLTFTSRKQGWKPKLKPKPENPVFKKIFDTQTETAKFLKTQT